MPSPKLSARELKKRLLAWGPDNEEPETDQGRPKKRSKPVNETPKPPNLQTWDDLCVGARPCYKLYKLKSLNHVVRLGKQVFDSLHGTVTSRAICQLMLLAYNLVDYEGTPVFGKDIPASLISTETKFSKIDDTELTRVHVSSTNRFTNNAPKHDVYLTITASAYSFVAASFLRLYAKPCKNFYPDLTNRFQSFYAYQMPFSNFMPPFRALQCIKSEFDANVTLRNTFYNFLYAGEAVEVGKQMKEYLYGMHVAYTGMHAYTLFLKTKDGYGLDSAELVMYLNRRCFSSEIENLVVIFENLYETEEKVGKEKQMWRFARVFDDRFFSALETSNCLLFTATLAELYHTVFKFVPRGDARKIGRLQEMMTRSMKLEAIRIAYKVFYRISVDQFDNEFECVARAMFGIKST